MAGSNWEQLAFDGTGKPTEATLRICGEARFSGIGCYGFADAGNWEGVTDELFTAFLDWLGEHARDSYRAAVCSGRARGVV